MPWHTMLPIMIAEHRENNQRGQQGSARRMCDPKAFLMRNRTVFVAACDLTVASPVQNGRDEKQQRAEEKQNAIMPAAKHDFAELRRDRRRQRSHRNGRDRATMMAALPETIRTIIVSPIARPKPRIIAAPMPGIAAGKTTRSAVCVFDAPRASEASR